MEFVAAEPAVSLLRRSRLRVIVRFLLILSALCRLDHCGIFQCAFLHEETTLFQKPIYSLEELLLHTVLHHPLPEETERRRIGNGLSKINAHEALKGHAFVDSLFRQFVAESVPILEEPHPQHRFRRESFPSGLRSLPVPQRLQKKLPWKNVLHVGEEFLGAGDLLAEEESGETRLHGKMGEMATDC